MYSTILVVDDEASIRQSLSGLLSDEGFEILTASNGYEALKVIDAESPDLVLLDIWMPGMDGIETLKEIKKESPYIQVIIITGHGTIETAVQATKLGAFDFIEKPLSIDKVIVAINNALNFRRLEEENKYLRKKTLERHSINGNSPAVQELKKQIMTAAPSDAWILISGENGAGKELVARTIHQLSSRAAEPMVDVNCAAIPDELIESELFGHEKGAFTGATTKKRGKFELASRGTIFFDEIGDMSLRTQGKILRVLQEKQFQRVGGNRTLDLDVRVIAASNKSLEEEITRGRFRKELFYRLNVIPIQVPPLRERLQDVPLLVDTFLAESARKNRSPKKEMDAEALELLCGYPWPGNVRELKNLIERLAIMVKRDSIGRADIPQPYNPAARPVVQPATSAPFFMPSWEEARRAFEREFLRLKLMENDNDPVRTAQAIGVEPDYLDARIQALGA